MRTSFVGKDGAMPSKYDENTKARAVRLVREHRDDYDSEWAAMKAIAGRLGMNTETLRKWVRQAEIDAGEAAGTLGIRESRQLDTIGGVGGQVLGPYRELENRA